MAENGKYEHFKKSYETLLQKGKKEYKYFLDSYEMISHQAKNSKIMHLIHETMNEIYKNRAKNSTTVERKMDIDEFQTLAARHSTNMSVSTLLYLTGILKFKVLKSRKQACIQVLARYIEPWLQEIGGWDAIYRKID